MIKILHKLIKKKILVNLVVFLILLGGLVMATRINREAYPEVNFDMVSIKTIYPGGSPDEMEMLISIPIEKKLREVDGIDKVRTYNIENVSVVVVYLVDHLSNRAGVVQDIKDKVELVDNLPDKAQKPIVEEIKLDKTNAINIAIYGKQAGVSYREIREAADDLEDFLYEIDGVAEVEDFGYYDREYLVEVNPDALKRNRLGINNVIDTLGGRNIDFPGGTLKIGDSEFVLRTKGQFRNAEEVKKTVILANDMGYATRIGDVAKVTDTFKEPTVLERFNGRKAVVFTVWKKRSADEIKLVDRIRRELKQYKPPHSENVTLQIFSDTSRFTRERISSVITNAITGFILLALILMLLLGPRLSTIVTTSIPIAFMTAFFSMKMGNITLNVVSLFGMIMVLGMIVDFGIVVTENSHRYMERGLSRIAAIEQGVAEVFWPVTVTLLCICAAFAPLLFLTGIIGKFVKAIPIVLMMCLAASWFIAMFIMPTHLDMFASGALHSKANGRKKESENGDDDPEYEKGAFGRVQRKYKKLLKAALNHRYLTLGILILMLIGSLFLVGVVGFVFTPGGGAEELEIKVKFSQETNLDANLREMRKMEEIVMKLPKKELDALHDRVGIEASDIIDPKPGEGTHKSTMLIYLTPEGQRDRTANPILAQLRREIIAAQKEGKLSPDMRFEFKIKEHGPPIGKPVNVEIRGKDFDVLKKIAHEYMAYLKTVGGVTDITLDLEEGKKEFRYSVNEVMTARTKISALDVAQSLNASFQGAVATSVREGKEDIGVRVRFPESARKKTESLDDVMIANKYGGLIPLDKVTSVNKQPGYTQINRLNYQRIVQVQGEVNTAKVTSMEVNNLLQRKFADIEKRYPGYRVTYGGEQEDTDKSMGEMGILFLFAILIIYIILAVFFDSLMVPLVVMSAIPFSLVGVVLTLFVHGQPLSFMGTLGIFSLAGVIVSNTLVLVQFINNMRDTGLPLKEALLEAGVIRLRPVILTSGTTVLGLFPTIYGLGGMDYFVAPLALAFGYGLIFATFITLILIPSFYHIAEDIMGFFSRLLEPLGIRMSRQIYYPRDKTEIVDDSEGTVYDATPKIIEEAEETDHGDKKEEKRGKKKKGR